MFQKFIFIQNKSFFLWCLSIIIFTSQLALAEKNNKPALNDPYYAEIDLWQSIQQAFVYNPELQQQFHIFQADEQSITQARAALLPNVSASASQGWRNDRSETFDRVGGGGNNLNNSATDIPDEPPELSLDSPVRFDGVNPRAQDNYESRNLSVRLSQPILDRERWMTLKQSHSQVDESEIEYHTTKQDLALEVVEAYFDYLTNVDNLSISKKEYAETSKHTTLTEDRYDNGIGTLTDLYESRARSKIAKVDIISTQSELKKSRARIEKLVGVQVIDVLNLPTNYDLPKVNMVDPDEWFMIALDNSLEVRLANQQIETADFDIKRQNAKHWPTLELVANSSVDDTTFSTVSSDNTLRRHEVMLQLNVPIFESFGTQSQVKEAYYRQLASQDNLNAVIKTKRNNIEDALYDTLSSYENTSIYEDAYVDNLKALRLRELGYLEGLSSNLDLLDAYRDTYDAERDWKQSRHDYIVNYLRLKRLSERISDEDILKINQILTKPKTQSN